MTGPVSIAIDEIYAMVHPYTATVPYSVPTYKLREISKNEISYQHIYPIPSLRYTGHASVRPPTLEVTNRAGTMLFGDTLGRRAQMAEQGIADAQGAFAPAMDHMRGCRIPKITHIRACGAHVRRMGKCAFRGVRQCGIRRRTWRRRPLR